MQTTTLPPLPIIKPKNFFENGNPHMHYYGYSESITLHAVVYNHDERKASYYTDCKKSEKSEYHEAIINHFGLKVIN
jgi:hypothetical protein